MRQLKAALVSIGEVCSRIGRKVWQSGGDDRIGLVAGTMFLGNINKHLSAGSYWWAAFDLVLGLTVFLLGWFSIGRALHPEVHP